MDGNLMMEAAPLGLDEEDRTNGAVAGEEGEQDGSPALQEFDTLFSTDLEPETVYFRLAGRECWVKLRPMGQALYTQYMQLGQRFHWNGDRKNPQIGIDQNLERQNLYLILNTLQDLFIVLPPKPALNSPGEFANPEEMRLPARAADREEFMKRTFRNATPKFWGWLLQQCERVNGLLEEQQGN